MLMTFNSIEYLFTSDLLSLFKRGFIFLVHLEPQVEFVYNGLIYTETTLISFLGQIEPPYPCSQNFSGRTGNMFLQSCL